MMSLKVKYYAKYPNILFHNLLAAHSIYPMVVSNELLLEGFLVTRWLDRWAEAIEANMKWIKEGKIKYKETVTEGFENIFKAFTSMLKGENTGKTVVKC